LALKLSLLEAEGKADDKADKKDKDTKDKESKSKDTKDTKQAKDKDGKDTKNGKDKDSKASKDTKDAKLKSSTKKNQEDENMVGLDDDGVDEKGVKVRKTSGGKKLTKKKK